MCAIKFAIKIISRLYLEEKGFVTSCIVTCNPSIIPSIAWRTTLYWVLESRFARVMLTLGGQNLQFVKICNSSFTFCIFVPSSHKGSLLVLSGKSRGRETFSGQCRWRCKYIAVNRLDNLSGLYFIHTCLLHIAFLIHRIDSNPMDRYIFFYFNFIDSC